MTRKQTTHGLQPFRQRRPRSGLSGELAPSRAPDWLNELYYARSLLYFRDDVVLTCKGRGPLGMARSVSSSLEKRLLERSSGELQCRESST